MQTKPFILVPLIAALAACGGAGTDSGNGFSSEGSVSVLVTDNLTQDYAEVWITVRSITAEDNNGQRVTLFEDTTGQTYNLSQLANIGALVDTQAVAAGTYTSFDITLGNDITLVDLNGNVTNATFDQSGLPTFDMNITGSLTVGANQNSTLALDFDLAQFTYDATTNTVSPVVVQKDPQVLDQTVATLAGQVVSITSPTEFVMTPAGGGTDMNVELHSSATVTNAATGEVLADTSALQTGMEVIVSGNFDPDTMKLTAASVQMDNNDAVSVRQEMEGFVVSFDGSMLVIDIKEASFAPPANEMSIDISNAIFAKGDLSLVADGQNIEIKGQWDGSSFMPAVVEIEGAPSNARHGNDDTDTYPENYQDEYAEVEGIVNIDENGVMTIAVNKAEHVNQISAGDSITIDTSNSWFKGGDNSCLVDGTPVEVKGPINEMGAMVANVIEIENGCGRQSRDSYHDEHRDNDSHDDEYRDDDSHDEGYRDDDSHDEGYRDDDSHDEGYRDDDSHDEGYRDDDSHDDENHDGNNMNDTGMNDTGMNDTGMNDTGMNDTGMNDSGMNDTGMNDTGMNDTGMNDTGMNDTGMNDTGMDDTGMDDTGMNDSGMDDTGMNDSGMDDSGMNDTGMNDTGMNDTGMNDSGMDDSGMDDTGMSDSGMNDSGMDDSGMDDSGMDDSGMDDTGMSDSGMDDAGMDDTGMSDSGMNDTGMNDSGMNDSGMDDSGMNGSDTEAFGNTSATAGSMN